MPGSAPPSPIDLTMSDDEDSYGAASDRETPFSLKTSLNRTMTDSSTEDMIDHHQLHHSIEFDVLGSIRERPRWSFGRISKPHTSQTKSMTPSSSQNSGILSMQSSQALVDNEYAFSKQPHIRRHRRELAYSRPSYEVQAVADDLYMLDAAPSTPSEYPAKRTRYSQPPAPGMPATLSDRQGLQDKEFRISENDYLDDEGLNALLESMVLRADDDNAEKELPPDTEQEVIDLEKEEAAEAAEEEDEDQTANDFMGAIAVDETNQELLDVIEISSDEDGAVVKERRKPMPSARPSHIRNVGPNNLRLTGIKYGNNTYKVGHGVEFLNGTFMRIKAIYRGYQGDVKFSGPLLIRHLHNVLDPKQPRSTRLFPSSGRQNEVIWTITVDEKPRSGSVQRDLSEAMCPREIVFTNQSWPCISSQAYNGGRKRGSSLLLNEGTLFCRWKRVKQLELKHLHQEYEESLERLTEEEADTKDSIKASKLRFARRRHHVSTKGGSVTVNQVFVAADGSIKTEKVTKYAFADCFCGCGGASRGAQLAGLAIQWAVDFDKMAAQSYRANFKSATFHHQDISHFLSGFGEPGAAAAYMVDVLHMSPPCQAFSPARTKGCPIAKEKLEALLLSVGDLLKAVKPRIATMEETSGLIERHKDWMTHLIRSIVDNGYSLRWKVVRSETFGVPQIRKRVIIIAAGPGEALPPFPKPMYGPASASKRRLATIHNAIGSIPPRATHNKVRMGFRDVKRKIQYSPHTQARTVTCGGGKNYHPSGLRNYTAREAACLQTFPFLHSFANVNLTAARRQIGNACPPALARAVFKSIVQSLKETDGVQ